MAKNKNLKISSSEISNETGRHHNAESSSYSANHQTLTGACKCGEVRCIEGILYRCMQDAFGDCVWFKTTETCY
jgi:hypothetical protein